MCDSGCGWVLIVREADRTFAIGTTDYSLEEDAIARVASELWVSSRFEGYRLVNVFRQAGYRLVKHKPRLTGPGHMMRWDPFTSCREKT
jgi:hypothetical protein